MKNTRLNISRRQFLGAAGGAAIALSLPELLAFADGPLFPQLAKVSRQFTFALIADTHVRGARDKDSATGGHEVNFRKTIAEINAMTPQPAFVAHVGDIAANPADACFEGFRTIAKTIKPLTVLTHGNHDGSEPWDGFRATQKAVNGLDSVMFSFDCGDWHFVTFPCNFKKGGDFEKKLPGWLASDLAANRDKPTIVFEHFHLLPQGLTQLETYTYEKEIRTEILNTLAKNGNVKYVICGHVHNGIKTTLKTAWTWRGINFITAPTCVPSRNFGEEFPEFASGQPREGDPGGGYYLLFDIDGDKVRVRGRLNGVKHDYVFPDTFRAYENQEPLWFKNAADLAAQPTFTNGSFEQGLAGWVAPYRYIADENPGFVFKAGGKKAADAAAAELFVREKGQVWAKDELTEIYQMVRVSPESSPLFATKYLLDAPDVGGGGYVRLCAFAGKTPKFHVFMDWGKGDRAANMRLASHAMFATTGQNGKAPDLIRLGHAKQAMFWRLPGEVKKWHDVKVDLAAAYDRAIASAGAYAKLGITELQVALGVWCGQAAGSCSGARFEEVNLTTAAGARGEAVAVNGAALPVDAHVFETEIGARTSKGEDAGPEPTEAKPKERKRKKK